jgi:mediator of RNA polymerase II transcription subunit 16
VVQNRSVGQPFSQIIQWVAHLALNILGRVPDHRKTSGYDIVSDNHALNILREVLVISHLWGFMKPQCLPVFMKNGNFSGLATLYRHITRLIQCNQNNEVDENFVDECYLLRNQVFFPTITLTALEINDIASPAFHREPLPMQFTFGCEPDSIPYEIDTFTLDGSSHTIQNTDIIKHIYLGESNPHKMKQCNRCRGKTQMVSSTKSWAIRSWEDRWMRSCLCGGRWRYIGTSRSPYSR